MNSGNQEYIGLLAQRLVSPPRPDRKAAVPREPPKPERARDKLMMWLVAIAMLVLGTIVDRADP